MSIVDVKNAYIETVREAGRESTKGLPTRPPGSRWAVQLIGYYMWQLASGEGRARIALADVECGYRDALLAFCDAVCAPALGGLSLPACESVEAMAQDAPKPSRVSEIAECLGRSRRWGNKYRRVLINELVVRPTGQGYVEFAIPHMAAWLNSCR